ncbi:pyridoxal phosphate-dependent transferase [Vibrio cholerae]|uniref:pyridoxal phosphate-dependent transferase n=1 Tax=Vibrio cholerae TaxID=666 RepID=UPI002270758C|nr:pyridoxal phosphate-dependent transferase [Vibrio cholerae]
MQIKNVGGEQELADDGRYYGHTNSGRSSLRWLIRSMELQGKTVLVPDFVCQVVIDVLLEFDIQVRFYAVHEDLEFSLPNELVGGGEKIDALYLVKYFGHASQAFQAALSQSQWPLIIDDVFGLDVPEVAAPVSWGYFNSLRKITAVADFSQVVCSVPLLAVGRERLVEFSTLKYQAKQAKAAFMHANQGQESDYLSAFVRAESLLNEEVGIFLPEEKSVYLAGQCQRNFAVSQALRQQNLLTAKTALAAHQYIDIQPDFASFLPLILRQRDHVRRTLMQHGIFLAVHWPQTEQVPNALSEQILSLPLDPRYDTETILRVCELIKELDQ